MTYLNAYSPAETVFPGSIKVLAGSNVQHSVLLRVLEEESPDDVTKVSVSVAVCGEGAFSGVLSFEGAARLTNPEINSWGESIIDGPIIFENGATQVGGKTPIFLNAQVFFIELVDVPRCALNWQTFSTAWDGFSVTGAMQESVHQEAEVLGFAAPRSRTAYPSLGEDAAWSGRQPLSGPYAVPGEGRLWQAGNFAAVVRGAPVPLGSVIEESEPVATAEGSLIWAHEGPMTPSARLLDRDWQTSLLQASGFLGIAFGLAGSILSTAVVSVIVRQHSGPVAVGTPTKGQHRGDVGVPTPKVGRMLLISGVFLGVLLARLLGGRR